MKNSFKKLISLVLVLAISFAMAVPAFAAEKTNNNSIKDILRSEYLVSASSNRVEFSRTIPVSSVKSNNLTANGMTSVQSFAKENVTVVPENETAANEIKRLLSSGGNNYEYLDDISGTIEIYTTVYYDTVTGYSDLSYTKMKKVAGGWTMSGSDGTSVVNGYIAYMQSGLRASTGGFINQTASTHKTSSSWTITIPSSWQGVIPGDVGNVQCNYQVTMQRPNGHQWSTDMLENHIE